MSHNHNDSQSEQQGNALAYGTAEMYLGIHWPEEEREISGQFTNIQICMIYLHHNRRRPSIDQLAVVEYMIVALYWRMVRWLPKELRIKSGIQLDVSLFRSLVFITIAWISRITWIPNCRLVSLIHTFPSKWPADGGRKRCTYSFKKQQKLADYSSS